MYSSCMRLLQYSVILVLSGLLDLPFNVRGTTTTVRAVSQPIVDLGTRQERRKVGSRTTSLWHLLRLTEPPPRHHGSPAPSHHWASKPPVRVWPPAKVRLNAPVMSWLACTAVMVT